MSKRTLEILNYLAIAAGLMGIFVLGFGIIMEVIKYC
jgi:hypothetical protein